ncbi:MAG: hypothetical protein WKF84_21390 [Pyrinomonadaceae bacterium]
MIFPELARGKIMLREATSNNPQIFTGLRQQDAGDRLTLIAISFSAQEENVSVKLKR